MRKNRDLLHRQGSKRFSLGCLCLMLGLDACAPASAQQPTETDSAPVEEKRFRWTTTGKVYLRYGGVKPRRPTNLFAFGEYNPEGDTISGRVYSNYTEFIQARIQQISFKNLPEEAPSVEQLEKDKQQLYRSYHSPSLETDDIGFDLYELLLGVEARSAENKKWQGKARATLDVFELGERLANGDWGGGLVEAHDFDSAGVREAFVALSLTKVGELRLGITEGVVQRLDAGAHEISASGGFFGDVSQTPWHVKQLGWELGNATSDNFPKVQYLAPKFYGISIGAEWFSNLRTPENSLKPFSRDSSSYCFPSLFYTNDKKLFEQKPEGSFQLYDNTEKPLRGKDFKSKNYYLQTDLLPEPIREAGCWQRSPVGSSWHEDAHLSVMGGNVAVAYEKDFPKKNLSLKFAARYGIRSSKATATESNDVLESLFKPDSLKLSLVGNDPPDASSLLAINRSASLLEQAVGFSTGLTWKGQSFFGSVTYQFPDSVRLENIGGEIISEKGIESVLWSVGIKSTQLIPHKKGNDGKRKKKGTLSLSFTQAFTKDPRYNKGKQEMTFLLNLQSLYPLTKNIALVANYWYGEAAVSVPFFATLTELPSQGVLFYERRLVPSHEIAVGLTMRF